jgi:hypothetical protein
MELADHRGPRDVVHRELFSQALAHGDDGAIHGLLS